MLAYFSLELTKRPPLFNVNRAKPAEVKGKKMTHLQSDKFNVAWFKLAEFVARKEKERAFGMYRLLIHSISDEGFATQLEGDLLLAFNDDKALASYAKASELYERNGKLTEAIAVSEHCLTLSPDSIEYITRLIQLYGMLKNTTRMMHYISVLMKMLSASGNLNELTLLLEGNVLSCYQKVLIAEYALGDLLCWIQYDKTIFNKFLTASLNAYAMLDDSSLLKLFMEKLPSLDKSAHEYARTYLSTITPVTID